ncbi:hypothetical protein VDGL01_06243 [Verticillium dahliae]
MSAPFPNRSQIPLETKLEPEAATHDHAVPMFLALAVQSRAQAPAEATDSEALLARPLQRLCGRLLISHLFMNPARASVRPRATQETDRGREGEAERERDVQMTVARSTRFDSTKPNPRRVGVEKAHDCLALDVSQMG